MPLTAVSENHCILNIHLFLNNFSKISVKFEEESTIEGEQVFVEHWL